MFLIVSSSSTHHCQHVCILLNTFDYVKNTGISFKIFFLKLVGKLFDCVIITRVKFKERDAIKRNTSSVALDVDYAYLEQND